MVPKAESSAPSQFDLEGRIDLDSYVGKCSASRDRVLVAMATVGVEPITYLHDGGTWAPAWVYALERTGALQYISEERLAALKKNVRAQEAAIKQACLRDCDWVRHLFRSTGRRGGLR